MELFTFPEKRKKRKKKMELELRKEHQVRRKVGGN